MFGMSIVRFVTFIQVGNYIIFKLWFDVGTVVVEVWEDVAVVEEDVVEEAVAAEEVVVDIAPCWWEMAVVEEAEDVAAAAAEVADGGLDLIKENKTAAATLHRTKPDATLQVNKYIRKSHTAISLSSFFQIC